MKLKITKEQLTSAATVVIPLVTWGLTLLNGKLADKQADAHTRKIVQDELSNFNNKES